MLPSLVPSCSNTSSLRPNKPRRIIRDPWSCPSSIKSCCCTVQLQLPLLQTPLRWMPGTNWQSCDGHWERTSWCRRPLIYTKRRMRPHWTSISKSGSLEPSLDRPPTPFWRNFKLARRHPASPQPPPRPRRWIRALLLWQTPPPPPPPPPPPKRARAPRTSSRRKHHPPQQQ